MARRCVDFIDSYLAHTAVSEAPRQSHFWVAVWTIAGALRRNVWYEAGGFTWTPNFYIVLVGPPGVIQKSTTASKGKRLLVKVPVAFGPNSATWHGMIPCFNAAEHSFELDGTAYRVSPLSMAVSELGTFLKLSQEGLSEVLIDMWEGGLDETPWTHTTQTHGDKLIHNGILNLIGCTTLGWLQKAVPSSELETGLISRIVFVYNEQKRELISIPNRDARWNPAAQRAGTADLVADLNAIAALRGPMTLAEDAYLWQDAWYRQLWASRPAHMAAERFDVYRSRKQTHLMKLALVLTASQGDSMTITLPTVQRALEALDAAEASVVRVFDTIGGPPEAQHTRQVVSLARSLRTGIAQPTGVTTAELFVRLRNVMTWDELCRALVAGIESGLLRRADSAERNTRGALLPGVLATTPKEQTQ